MIPRSEVTAWAERFGVTAMQIARDHFISHVLAALGDRDSSTRFFGGTALCRTYLDASRLSEDVDLLYEDPTGCFVALTRELPRALRHEFPNAELTMMRPDGDGMAAEISAPGVDPIKIYVGRDGANTRAWEFAATKVMLRYSDLPATKAFQCPTVATFGAMKLAAWFDRHAPRALFDLSGLARLGVLADPAVRRIFRAKMGTAVVAAEFARVPRTTLDAWETELGAQVPTLPPAQECLDVVRVALDG